MNVAASPALSGFFLRLGRYRLWIVAACALLTGLGALGAIAVPQDTSIDRLMVQSDPLAQATRRFERIFPEGSPALLMLEAADPFQPAVLQAARRLENRLGAIPGVQAHSVLTIYSTLHRRATPDDIAQLRRFATATPLFRRAGLVGEHYLGIGLELHVHTPEARDRTLAAIDVLALPLAAPGGPFSAVRRVGAPWVDAWLERQTTAATAHSMPLFGLFVTVLVLALYRSWRTLAAFMLTLAAVLAMAMGIAAPLGWAHTVVSALVPLTVMITTTATLVYIHSRYVDRSDASSLAEHQAAALANKFVPCTASIFATAVGFGALAVSDIRPIHEMGLWTASGLALAWIGSFTLFPALQSLLRTPTRTERSPAAVWFPRLVDALVPFTRRWRWPLVVSALALMAAGAGALFGVPHLLAQLPWQGDALSYVNPRVAVAADTRRFEQLAGLTVMDLWLQTPPGQALDPQFLRAMEHLERTLQQDPRITSVEGPTTLLRWERYLQSGSDQLPTDPAAWPKLAGDLEQILLTEPAARGFVDVGTLANARLALRGRDKPFGGTSRMREYVERVWSAAQAADPALRGVRAQVVGQSVLAEQIAVQLVPTLIESFALTASIILCVFLLVFRSAAARLMAMIPSLFAILTAFLIMRLASIPLNIATILIGSTVLGATENDQVHFFYHFQESRRTGSVSAALRHALTVAGRPIFFATLINAAGFLALALSDLPPMRQFGTVSACAFALALLADFTALPAALWILGARLASAPLPEAAPVSSRD